MPAPALPANFPETTARMITRLVRGLASKPRTYPVRSAQREQSLRLHSRTLGPSLEMGGLLLLWLVFGHKWVEMAAPQSQGTW